MRITLLIFSIFLSGCQSNNFEKVDFKYSNLAHMSVDDAIIELDIDPKTLIFALSDSFRAQNNMVLEREKLDFFNRKSADYKACLNAQNDVFKTEFLAYQQNDFSIYKGLNRGKVFSKYGVSPQCGFFDIIKSDVADSWFLKVEVPQGNFNTTVSVPNVESFFGFSGTNLINGSSTTYKDRVITTNFSSHLYIWVWQETPDSKTKVYLYSKPVNGQVEACAGCSIGYRWWKQANGYTESRLVKHYKYLLEDLANKNLFLN
ncbi:MULTISPECIES: hypothetical protein [unclassified Pseudoalteromonas]|uniref:hypothetical protein n=1 Tax=unclassified Pseudoalteromonas TaxID=194690 RepID=UPI0011089B34|nr:MULTISPECIES: hypothetical protein [unclassified Pseudoalteromonas]MBB1429798.1 hypothetical protein [Pseudoalteromonas sp. SG43-4]TMN83750.1 hypothetical protein CWB64_07065 [Pseudoalteromonas sp. S410]TMN91689.1 hypothetical protein CWB62_06275 [Pseudoalteromonas sp. S408]TMN94974.1 hypothetical protein CWB63_18335 [Pseudoalteromonas sp. S409]TMN96098.1 hypothetical protein CWB61_13210 [Pseudoalteromonas sp. S407]